ncbi:UTP4 protein, partial [Columbina picui]|nr:UTP4 protein [Columbina picui]
LARLSTSCAVDGGGGPIWSMAANGSGTRLAIGCEDGSVKLFQVVPGGIQFERNLDRRKGRILCLSWHPSDSHIAAGSIDILRVLDVSSGQTVQRIMVNYHVQKVQRECVVWSVIFLASSTIVTSDSFGRVQFWDWQRGTLVESHTVSTSSALSLAVSEKEDSIIVGTSTGATYQLQLLPVRVGSLEKRWVRTKPFQHHTHDVRAVGGSSRWLPVLLLPLKVPKVPKLLLPAYQLQFAADSGTLFVASARGSVHVLQLLEPGGCKHLHTLCPPSETPEAVYLLAVSADGRWVAAVAGDWAIHIYNLKCFKHHCTVPTYSCAVTALAIHPVTNNLVIAYADQQLFEFSIPEQQYTAWSRMVQNCGLHRLWLERDTHITHITFNPKNPLHILLHDVYMFCVLDKSLPLPDNSALLLNQSTLKQLPETARQRQLHAFKICKKFQ